MILKQAKLTSTYCFRSGFSAGSLAEPDNGPQVVLARKGGRGGVWGALPCRGPMSAVMRPPVPAYAASQIGGHLLRRCAQGGATAKLAACFASNPRIISWKS
jgi:hypothetical protein